MERLNQFIKKEAPRRPASLDSRSFPQGALPPGRQAAQSRQSLQQPAQPTQRGSSQEATLHSGPRNAYTQQRAYPPTVRSHTTQEMTHGSREGRAYGAINTHQVHLSRAANPAHNTAGYPPLPQALSQEEVLPPSHLSHPSHPSYLHSFYSQRAREQREYHTGEYPPPADVAGEWEVDDAGMCYGDWEVGNDEVLIYQRPDVKVVSDAALLYAPDTRDIPNIADPVTRDRITRNLRNTHDMQPPVAAIPLPTIQQTRISGEQHRITQPLNPQAVINASRGRVSLSELRRTRRASQVVPLKQPEAETYSPLKPPLVSKDACVKCKGAGYLRADVSYGHPNFGKPIPCECKEIERKEKRRQQLRSMSNLDAFRSSNFRTFNPRVPGVQEAYEVCNEYAQNPYGWLLLLGTNGCGKTHLATAIANQCLDNGSVVLFSVVPDLLDHLRATFMPRSEEPYDMLFSKMREAEVLVLDDLGAHQSSPWANEKLFQLFNYRYSMGMPMVITSNPKGLQNCDERILSRLSDVNLVYRIDMDKAKDYRPNHPRR